VYSACERRGTNLTGFMDLYLKAKAIIWPWLSYMCHIRSTAGAFARSPDGPIFKLPPFLKLINTDPFAVWFVVTGDATPDGIRVVRSVLDALNAFNAAPRSTEAELGLHSPSALDHALLSLSLSLPAPLSHPLSLSQT